MIVTAKHCRWSALSACVSRLTRSCAAPLKTKDAFSPGVAMVAATLGPPMASVPAAARGSAKSESVAAGGETAVGAVGRQSERAGEVRPAALLVAVELRPVWRGDRDGDAGRGRRARGLGQQADAVPGEALEGRRRRLPRERHGGSVGGDRDGVRGGAAEQQERGGNRGRAAKDCVCHGFLHRRPAPAHEPPEAAVTVIVPVPVVAVAPPPLRSGASVSV
jgi:hypothetical protein